MNCARIFGALLCLAAAGAAQSQEAKSGVDLRATLTAQTVASNELTEAPRSGSPIIAAARAVLYPTVKFSDRWFATGALQLVTRPYYYDELSTAGYGATGRVLNATLNYSRVSSRGSFLVRAGEMSTAFGSFLLRYDDADNALVGLPPEYGYYYAQVSILGVAGAQIDAARGKWDGRAQFANSSPANPRSIFARDQYGNWAGGAGYTIRQGLRVGVSGYRGPYLDRQYKYFFPGEANPNTLPAHALGVDANWTHAHTTAYIELQKFTMPYTVIPNFRESVAYGEVRQALGARWFLAGRYSYVTNSVSGRTQTFESAAGYRPGRFEILKIGYQEEHYHSAAEHDDHIFAIQFVTTLHKSIARE